MTETINGHVLEIFPGHTGTLVYADNCLAADGDKVRPHKGAAFWRWFLAAHPELDAKCLLPRCAPWHTSPTFEELYKEEA